MIDLQLIAQVREAREKAAAINGDLASERLLWEAAHADLLIKSKEAAAQVTVIEIELRSAILAEFAATGNKAPAPGCSIRILTKLTYPEPKALEWAKAHGIALRLDVKRFEQLAKVEKPDFVEMVEEPQPLISQDLEKALKEGGEAK